MDQLNDINPVERFLVDKANMKRVPISVTFELTPYCNLHCDMCYIRMGKKQIEDNGGLMQLEDWIRIAEELKKMGTLFILLTGGEPMSYPYFKELYLRLRQMGFIITINTNATLLTNEIAQLFYEHKPRRVNVTLYGSSNETYWQLCHVKQGYDRCMEGLERLKQYGIDARLNLTVLKKNQADYPELVATADRLGLSSLDNCYMSVFCRTNCSTQLDIPSLRMSPEDVAAVELSHKRHVKGKDFKQYLLDTEKLIQTGESLVPYGIGLTCRAGKSSCWINWQGMMTPCVDMEEPGISLREYAVGEAWAYLVDQCNVLPYHQECSGCKLKAICDVCYANASNEKKCGGSVNYLCEIARAKHKQIQTILKELE